MHMQCNAMQYNAIPRNAAQYSAVLLHQGKALLTFLRQLLLDQGEALMEQVVDVGEVLFERRFQFRRIKFFCYATRNKANVIF